jgi:hypothetical protein
MLAPVDVIVEQRLHLGHALADFPYRIIPAVRGPSIRFLGIRRQAVELSDYWDSQFSAR